MEEDVLVDERIILAKSQLLEGVAAYTHSYTVGLLPT